MSQIRKKYSNEYKAQVALSAIKEECTVSELSSQYGVHPTQINKWKRLVLSGMKNIFVDNANKQQYQHDNHVKDLHAKIGQLTIEKDFLADASSRLTALRGNK
jgi:transposase